MKINEIILYFHHVPIIISIFPFQILIIVNYHKYIIKAFLRSNLTNIYSAIILLMLNKYQLLNLL